MLDRLFEGAIEFTHQLSLALGPACSRVHRRSCLRQLAQSCADAVSIADVYVAARKAIHAVMPHTVATSVIQLVCDADSSAPLAKAAGASAKAQRRTVVTPSQLCARYVAHEEEPFEVNMSELRAARAGARDYPYPPYLLHHGWHEKEAGAKRKRAVFSVRAAEIMVPTAFSLTAKDTLERPASSAAPSPPAQHALLHPDSHRPDARLRERRAGR